MSIRHKFDPIPGEDPDLMDFGVFEKDGGWFWEWNPTWRSSGPFPTEQSAIAAGRRGLNPDGSNYFQ